MPPEQLPWDRRDFRKHERSASDPRFGGGGGEFGGGGPHRWRDHHHPHSHMPPSPHPPPYHHQHNPQQPQRWYSDFRSSRPIATGHGKQGGWHMYPDESSPGFQPFGSRHTDRNLEDDIFRPVGFRGDGRYLRNSRESRGAFSNKDWRSPIWKSNATSNGSGKLSVEVNNQKFVENMSTSHDNHSKSSDTVYPVTVLKEECDDSGKADFVAQSSQDCVPPSGLEKLNVEFNNQNNVEERMSTPENSNRSRDSAYAASFPASDWQQPAMKAKHEDGGGPDGVTRSNQKTEKENFLGSIDWTPLKWSRSGSLLSRGSALLNSMSSKSIGVHNNEAGGDSQLESIIPAECSAARDGVASFAPNSSDDSNSRKKARLGWGEGLAKYERKKVEGPEDSAGKVGLLPGSYIETVQSSSVNLLEKSLGGAALPMCTTPTTPCSVASGLSSGLGENESNNLVSVDQENISFKSAPDVISQNDYEGPTFNLENLEELSSITNLSNMINQLLHFSDCGSVETDYAKSALVNKLLVWKGNVLRALEVTESEIDLLESEYKSRICDVESCCTHPSISDSPTGKYYEKFSDKSNGSGYTIESNLLKPVMPGHVNIDDTKAGLENKLIVSVDEEVDSQSRDSPKLVDSLPSGLPFEKSECDEYLSMKLISSGDFDGSRCKSYESDGNNIYDSIISANKVSANKVTDELNNLIPSQWRHSDMSSSLHLSHPPKDPFEIKERFLMKRRALLFNEKVLIITHKVFKHFWKEGHVVSVKKLRGKSHKKFDQNQIACNSNRFSSRSRLFHSAGSHLTVPAEEIIDVVNSLLAKSPFKPCRSTLNMPPLILDRQKNQSRFISNNALVDDPCAAEKERAMFNPWTAEEKQLFIDKLAMFGKDFKRIASFLEHKTIADCVEFYYKNHKSECFSRAKIKPDGASGKAQSSTYLVGTGKRWNREMNAASLDILGEVANANDYAGTQPKCKSRMLRGSSHYQSLSMGDRGAMQLPNHIDFYSNSTAAVDVLAGICGSLSSEAMGSCITLEPADGNQDMKLQRDNSCIKRPFTPDVTQHVDDECSDESCEEIDSIDWTDEEKSMFIQAVKSYGKDFSKISCFMRTRTRNQCKIFFSKARKCLGLDLVQPAEANVVSDNMNGGGSDTEAASLGVDSTFAREDDKVCKENGGHPFDATGVKPIARNLSPKPLLDKNIMIQVSERCNENGSLVGTLSEHLKDSDTESRCIFPREIHGDGMMTEHQLSSNLYCPPDADSSIARELEKETVAVAETCNIDSSRAIPLQQNDLAGMMDSSSVLFPVPIHYGNNGFENVGSCGVGSVYSQKIFQSGDCYSGSSHPESSIEILNGYPVSVTTFKEITRYNDGDTHDTRKDKKLPSDWSKDFSLQKCSNSRRQNETALDRFQSSEQSSSSHTRYQSGTAVKVDKPSRNGDVKLFGKILVSSQQEPSNAQKITNDGIGQHHKEAVNLKLGGDQHVKAVSSVSNYDSIPNGTCGFWSGYGTVNKNGSAATLDLEQLPPHKMGKSNDCYSNGVSVNRVTGNHSVQKQELLQPLMMDTVNEPQDVVFSELHRQKGCDAVSGIHPKGGMIGVGESGVLQCPGALEPPTAAIKMRCSKAQNVHVHGGNLVGEERINGDVGR